MFVKIDADNFRMEVSEEKCPLLLAYIYRDHSYLEQVKALESVARIFGGALKICLIDHNLNGVLHHFQIEGSPTFIIFSKGKEKGRVLGRTDKEKLVSLAFKLLSEIDMKSTD